MKKITDRIYYVGVNDRTTALFERLWPIPHGVSYNSYIVKGDNAIALIDGVEIAEIDALLTNLEGCTPDYLVVNHMEPDHSGSLGLLHKLCPTMKFVGNTKTIDMLRGYYSIPDSAMMAVKDNDTIDLGGATLTFRMTPMVHWPETMMTYVAQEQAIFTGDAFGCFGALSGAVVDSDMDTDRFMPEMVRYYASIVGKYGAPVQKAIAKVSDLDFKYICPTHGPVWHDRLSEIVSLYDRMSRYEAEDGVTIIYGSMYGNTTRLAEAVATQLATRGIRSIAMHDVSTSDLSDILADVFRYRAIAIGAPTYNNGLFPPVEYVLNAIKARDIKQRIVGVFGSYTWASKAVKCIDATLEECGLLDQTMPEVVSRQAPAGEALEGCVALADAIADKLFNQ